MGDVITGRSGTLKYSGTTLEVKNWKASIKNKVASVATSTTSGWKTTAMGIGEWDQSFDAILPSGSASLFDPTSGGLAVGSLISFAGTTNGSQGLTGYARIDSFEESVPIDGGDLAVPVHAVGDGVPTLT